MNDSILAVIFDMDGVLVDSYQAHYESWRAVAREEGLAITELQFAAGFGRTSREVIASLWAARRYTHEKIALMDQRKEAVFREVLAAEFPAMPGARELVAALGDRGFSLAVGSSAPPENIDLCLDRLRVRDRFSAVVSALDVTRGKPDPQVFLLAAQRLGVPPSKCAVVEDAGLGVQAAHAAGMVAIGLVSTGRTRESLAAAELVVDKLGDLDPAAIRTLILSHSLPPAARLAPESG